MTFGGFGVLEKKFIRVYTKFKLHFYRETFARFQNREASLTTVAIYALGNPTVRQFAEFMGISSSNAAYKTASLVRKGYLIKERSKTDAREYHLVPTQKYLDYYNVSADYVHIVMERIKKRFSAEDVTKIEEVLSVMSEELMSEVPL